MEEFIKDPTPEEMVFNHSNDNIEELEKKELIEEEKNKKIENYFLNNYQKPNIEKKY